MQENKQIWNVKKLLNWATKYFTAKNIPQPKLSAELLLSSVLVYSRMELYLNFDYVLGKNELAIFKEYILKRLQNMPIQYILKESYFRNLKLYVDENVLIPRPETELLVDKVLLTILGYLKFAKDSNSFSGQWQNTLNILEIGIGSGAITLSIASEIDDFVKKNTDFECNFCWHIVATEKSQEAIKISIKNAKRSLSEENLEKVEFIECDLIPYNDTAFDERFLKNINIIVSNPPYISENDYNNLPFEVLKYEPRQALLAGKTGLEVYKRIIEKIKPYIFPELCYIIFEIDPGVSKSLKDLAENLLNPVNIVVEKDYNNKDRIMIMKI